MKQKKEKRDERKPHQSIRCIALVFLKPGRKKEAQALQPRARQSEYGDTYNLQGPVRKQGRSGFGFCFPKE
jgi:hypothetical protein